MRAGLVVLGASTATMTAALPIGMTISTGLATVVLFILFNCFTNVNNAQAGIAGAFH